MANERMIYFTNDADGVWRVGFSPVTAWRILRGRLEIPAPLNCVESDYNSEGGIFRKLEESIHLGWHRVMPPIGEAVSGLKRFQEVATTNGREMKTALLTGREPYKHRLTMEQFGFPESSLLFDDFFLNPGVSSSGWKEYIINDLVDKGFLVVHIDDDLRTGKRVARINDKFNGENRVLTYVVRNFWNGNLLIPKGFYSRLDLPPNLVLVDSYVQASKDFEQKLKEGWF